MVEWEMHLRKEIASIERLALVRENFDRTSNWNRQRYHRAFSRWRFSFSL